MIPRYLDPRDLRALRQCVKGSRRGAMACIVTLATSSAWGLSWPLRWYVGLPYAMLANVGLSFVRCPSRGHISKTKQDRCMVRPTMEH